MYFQRFYDTPDLKWFVSLRILKLYRTECGESAIEGFRAHIRYAVTFDFALNFLLEFEEVVLVFEDSFRQPIVGHFSSDTPVLWNVFQPQETVGFGSVIGNFWESVEKYWF